MLNWGDKEVAERLAAQLRELLRDRTMTHDQLASCYSIKHGQSVTQKLRDISRDRDRRPMLLSDFTAQMGDFFEIAGKNTVKARAGDPAASSGAPSSLPAEVKLPSVPPWRPSTAAPLGGPVPVVTFAPSVPPPAAAAAVQEPETPSAPATIRYADVARYVAGILKESHEPLTLAELESQFLLRFGANIPDVAGMSTSEYLQRKENLFDFSESRGTVFLQSSSTVAPPVAEPDSMKDETFVVKEFEALIEAMGPVVYISTLCGKFIQRNGISVTSVITTRPLDLFKRHPEVFLIVGAGNVTLKRYEKTAEVQRLMDKPTCKAQRIARAAEEALLPIPGVISEQHVVEEFRRLILADATDSVYISSLCGRFLQRFKKPVTAIINCKPADFLRRYPEVFVMLGGGNVGLREVLGPGAISVPAPPPRLPKAVREDPNGEAFADIELTSQVLSDIHSNLAQGMSLQAVVQKLMAVCRAIEQASFLALDEVVLGGAAGKGLVTSGRAGDIVLFVRQLPFRNFPTWLPHILETLAPVLEYQLASQRAERFQVEKDRLTFFLRGTESDLPVTVFLSPVFKSREHLLECIKNSPVEERFYFLPALVKERNNLVGGQPERIKVLIRLMNWWVSRQSWSSPTLAPSDWHIELLSIYAYRALKEAGTEPELSDLVLKVLELFAGLDKLKVDWTGTGLALYAPEDIWQPLLAHCPLLMDPVTPYANLVDVNSFDGSQLMLFSQLPGALSAFKREAASLLKGQEEGPEGAGSD